MVHTYETDDTVTEKVIFQSNQMHENVTSEEAQWDSNLIREKSMAPVYLLLKIRNFYNSHSGNTYLYFLFDIFHYKS